MAVEAIHRANGMFGGGVFKVRGAVLGDFAVWSGKANPGDDLAFWISGDVFDFVLRTDVPMNAFDKPFPQVAATDFEAEPDGERCVGLVGEEVRVSAIEVAAEFLRPMALLAGLTSR